MNALDSVTVLRCAAGKRATKLWRIDATTAIPVCDDYDCGAWFEVSALPVGRLEDLAGVIDRTRRDPRSFVVMGEPLPGVNPRRCRRLLHRQADGAEPTFRSVARYWLPIDFDDVPGPYVFDPANAELAGIYCRSKLPPEFHRAAYIWQATSGCSFKPGCRVRLWHWLDHAITGAEAERWLIRCPVDPSVWRPVQPVYCADPVLSGLQDPVKGDRFGIEYDRDLVVTVPELPKPKPAPASAPTHSADGRRYVSGQSHDVAQRRLDALAGAVTRAAKGGRHRCLIWAAARAVELDDAISRGEIAERLATAARAAGIDDTDQDLRRQIKNGFAIGVFGTARAGGGA